MTGRDGIHAVLHYGDIPGDGHRRLSVQHNTPRPGDRIRELVPSHYVSFSHSDRTGRVRVGSVSRNHDGSTSVRAIGYGPLEGAFTGPREPVAPMSERLQRLIEEHAKDPDAVPWYVLGDAIAEEYTDLGPHYDEHHAARYSAS